jgi:hypothetical protein
VSGSQSERLLAPADVAHRDSVPAGAMTASAVPAGTRAQFGVAWREGSGGAGARQHAGGGVHGARDEGMTSEEEGESSWVEYDGDVFHDAQET